MKSVLLICQRRNYPMSSIFSPKNQGKNRAFFSLIFAHFLLQNHNILWFWSSIFRFYHNVSSESQFQRVALLFVEHKSFAPLFSHEYKIREDNECGSPAFLSLEPENSFSGLIASIVSLISVPSTTSASCFFIL